MTQREDDYQVFAVQKAIATAQTTILITTPDGVEMLQSDGGLFWLPNETLSPSPLVFYSGRFVLAGCQSAEMGQRELGWSHQQSSLPLQQ